MDMITESLNSHCLHVRFVSPNRIDRRTTHLLEIIEIGLPLGTSLLPRQDGMSRAGRQALTFNSTGCNRIDALVPGKMECIDRDSATCIPGNM